MASPEGKAYAKRIADRERLAFRPFGGHNYSYPEEWMRTASFSVWALVTAGSLAVDWREAAIVLAVSLLAQEKGWPYTFHPHPGASGASWVHNVQAGYCAYHLFFRGNKKWLVFLATWYELGANAVAFSGVWGRFADNAHLEGFVEGLASAFLLDKWFKKKRPLL